MHYLNDEYTLNIDDLGYKEQADSIRTMILDCATPFTIGISGRWGSGKTSMMKYLMASIGGRPLRHRLAYQSDAIEENFEVKTVQDKYENVVSLPVHALWFNPWEHENHEEPFVELLKEIRNHFDFISKSKDETKKLASTTILAGIDILGSLLKMGSNPGSHVKQIGERYEHDHFEYQTRSQRFKLIFEEAIRNLLGIPKQIDNVDEVKKRLVIFIDDLDRCEEETISRLLKEIKQYLSTKYCVFVFGYDRHHIEKAMADKMGRSAKETRAYLEKLFQTTFYLPQPKTAPLQVFIKERVMELPFLAPTAQTKFSEFLADILDPNPRRLKMFFNSFAVHVMNSKLESKKDINFDISKKMALIAYLNFFYEPVYTVLENDPTLLADIVSVFHNRDRAKAKSPRELFLYMELKSHIQGIELENFDPEKFLGSGKEDEDKFLREIYEMQGRHSSFNVYMRAFEVEFKKVDPADIIDITDYL